MIRGMGRFVVPRSRDEILTGPRDTAKYAESPDGYLARVAKYIPGEVVVLYIGAAGILKSVDLKDAVLVLRVYWIIFVLCLILTPLYLNKMAKKDAKIIYLMQIIARNFPDCDVAIRRCLSLGSTAD